MKIPVIDQRGITLLDTRHIARIRSVERSFQFQTIMKTYYEIDTMAGMEKLLGPLGFARVNKNELINLSLIKGYDKVKHTLYFDHHPGPGTLKVVISRNSQIELRDFLSTFDKN